MSALNTEFGRTSTLQLSFSQSYAGVFAQYGAINRNTSAGQFIYSQNLVGTDFQLIQFYNYNDTEFNYWEYVFDGNSANFDVDVTVSIASTSIYNATIPSNSTDSSGAYIDTGASATTGGDLNLQLGFPSAGTVDILVTDPDTSAIIYQVTGDDMNFYKSNPVLATIYGYQRLNFSMTLFN